MQVIQDGETRRGRLVARPLGFLIALGDRQKLGLPGQGLHRTQDEGVLDAEDAGEASAVGGELQMKAREQPGLQGGEAGLEVGDRIGGRRERSRRRQEARSRGLRRTAKRHHH